MAKEYIKAMAVMLTLIILFISFIVLLIYDSKKEKQRELEIKKREETDVVFRYRNIPDEFLADHYIMAKYYNDTAYMEDVKKVMIERSKKASFEEAFDYYYKLYDEWRSATNYGWIEIQTLYPV